MQDWVACVFSIHVTCYSILGRLQRISKKRGGAVYLEWKESGGGRTDVSFTRGRTMFPVAVFSSAVQAIESVP